MRETTHEVGKCFKATFSLGVIVKRVQHGGYVTGTLPNRHPHKYQIISDCGAPYQQIQRPQLRLTIVVETLTF